MTTNRKAKAAARQLAEASGRSYTHAQRAESAGGPAAAAADAASPASQPVELLPHFPSTFPGPGTCAYCGRWYPLGQENEGCPERPARTEPAAIKRFPADAELLVDAHNGPETWSGEQWNAFADSCEDPVTGGPFTIELLAIPNRGTEPAQTMPVDPAKLAELHRQALALGELLEQAAPLLGIYGQAARRLAELGDAAAFYDGAQQLARDVDDLRATPNGHKTDALYRWTNNPVDAAYGLARHARMVALDRCELDEHDRQCSGTRSLSLAVWTVDGLSEAWPELCVGHLVDYADRWDPRYAELVIGGEYHAARQAFAELHSRRQGDINVRIAGPGRDRYGRKREDVPVPAGTETCRFCGMPKGEEHEC